MLLFIVEDPMLLLQKTGIIWTSDFFFFQVIARSLSSNSKILFSEVLHTTVECLKSLKIQGDAPDTRVQPLKARGHPCGMGYRGAEATAWPTSTVRKVIWIVSRPNFTPRDPGVLLQTARSRVLKGKAWLAAWVWWSPYRM